MTTITAQFWIRFRGVQDVTYTVGPGDTAEVIARVLVTAAIYKFNKRWIVGRSDRQEMVCTGITNGTSTLHAKDLPQ